MPEAKDISPEANHSVPTEVKRFFNPESRIIQLPGDEGYLVDTVLDNGAFVAGGQKLCLRLSPKVDIFWGQDGEGNIHPGQYLEGYSIVSLSLGGQEFLQEDEQVYLIPTPDSVDLDLRDPISNFSISDLMYAHESHAFVILRALKTGDSLAEIVHELGHCQDDSDYRELENMADQLVSLTKARLSSSYRSAIISPNSKGIPSFPPPTPAEQDLFLGITKHETRADAFAIKRIIFSRQKGVDLFPADPDLQTVRELFRTAIQDRFTEYADIPKSLGGKINELFDF
jgi:hypothetical protein